jgi:NADH dehydrogenase
MLPQPPANPHPYVHHDVHPRRWELAVGGAVAGLTGGVVVGALMTHQGMFTGAGGGPGVFPVWTLPGAVGALTGAVLGPLVGYRPKGLAMTASAGMTIGLLGWVMWFLTVAPILRGGTPTWSVTAAAGSYRELVASVLYGALTGALFHALAGASVALRARRPGPEREAAPRAPRAPRVVIIGGGFAGVSAAQRFERLALRGHRVDVTLVSGSNYLLFTPMLAEVASGALQAQHISAPVRAAAAHTRFCHGVAERIDTEWRLVDVATASGPPQSLPYDHLVLAVGSVPNTFGLPGIDDHAFALKDLEDARRLRDHVLGLLERADQEIAASERRVLLTFVVAGGGFAGTEAIAELFDLVHGVLHYYPGIRPDEPRFVLVHSGERILPELTAELGGYALERLRARGIEFRLGVRAASATGTEVRTTDGERIATRTFVWTAGQRPSPLVDTLPGERGRGGALVVDAACRVLGADRMWAVGDCAQIPDTDHDGRPYPPTAQHAVREGRVVADNVAAVLRNRPPRPFRFRTLGVFVALGHRTAAGEIRGRRFSGLAAWLLWRGIYLAKLPGLEKRVRVLFDWLLDLAFPRDIAVTARAPRAIGAAVESRPEGIS